MAANVRLVADTARIAAALERIADRLEGGRIQIVVQYRVAGLTPEPKKPPTRAELAAAGVFLKNTRRKGKR